MEVARTLGDSWLCGETRPHAMAKRFHSSYMYCRLRYAGTVTYPNKAKPIAETASVCVASHKFPPWGGALGAWAGSASAVAAVLLASSSSSLVRP